MNDGDTVWVRTGKGGLVEVPTADYMRRRVRHPAIRDALTGHMENLINELPVLSVEDASKVAIAEEVVDRVELTGVSLTEDGPKARINYSTGLAHRLYHNSKKWKRQADLAEQIRNEVHLMRGVSGSKYFRTELIEAVTALYEQVTRPRDGE